MSQVITDFRAKHPQYDGVADDQLATALHSKYYSQIPREEFNQKIGYQVTQPDISTDEQPQMIEQPQQLEPQVPLQDQEYDGMTGAATPYETPMLDMIGEKMRNLGAGAAERAGDVGGALLETIQTIGTGLEEKLPAGGFIWEDGDVIPSYKTPEEFAQADAPMVLSKGANALKDIDLGYQEQVGWQDVKDSFSKGGALSGSAYANVLEYGLEQGIKSVPDMVAAVYSLPTYIVARSGEIGEIRAQNNGKDKADVTDVLWAAPFAAASALLERIGAKGMTSDAKADLGAEMIKRGIKESTKRVAKAGGKALTKEAATEAIQEGMIEYVGEKFGTDASMDFAEALDRAAAGAVAGGVMGGTVATTTSAMNEINYSPEKELAKSLEADVKDSIPVGMEAEAVAALKPENAQREVIKPTEKPIIEKAKPEAVTAMPLEGEEKKDVPATKKRSEDIVLAELDTLTKAVRDRMGDDQSPMLGITETENMTSEELAKRKELIDELPSFGEEAQAAKARIKESREKIKAAKWEKRSKRSWKDASGQVIADLTISGGPKLYMVFKDAKEFDAGNQYATGESLTHAKRIASGGELDGKATAANKSGKLKSEIPKSINVAKFSTVIKKSNPTVAIRFGGRGDVITLDKIVVPETGRSKGAGTKAMNDVIKLADKNSKTIALTPSEDFGGNKKRLIDFYKGFGFVENKGKSKDYEISESMYRTPEKAKPAVLKSAIPAKTGGAKPIKKPLFSEDNRLNNINKNGGMWGAIKSENPDIKESGTVKIYRVAVGDTIRPNDYVAANKSVAEGHLENLKDRGEKGNMIEMEVPIDHLVMANDATEFTYSPLQEVASYSIKSFSEFSEALKYSNPTKVDIQASFDSLVKNKDSVLAELQAMTKKKVNVYVNSPRSSMTKQQLIDQAYRDILAAHSIVRDHTTEFNNSETYEAQITEAVKAQSQEDIDTGLAFQNREVGDNTKNESLETRREEIKAEKVPAKLNSERPTTETGAIVHAPGHNYVQLYRSMGLPARREVVDVNGRLIKMPSEPQRIEPIMRDLVSIMGRRIYNAKIKGKSSEGFYRPAVGELRTRRKNDVEVLAHEMAHYLDIYSNETLPNFEALYKKPEYSAEVAALSYTDATPELELIEGFAEFTRLWLTNSTEAVKRAPGFNRAFNHLLSTDKKLNKKMRSLQANMHKYYFQGADHLGRALIGQDEGMYGKFMDWTYRRDSLIRQQTIDKMHAVREVEKELTDQIGTVQESAWKQFRIANGGYEGIAEYIMNYGTLGFAENGDLLPNGKGLYEILKPVDTIDMGKKYKGEKPINLLMRYFAGRRALELHKQDRENLIPKETAKTWAKMGKDFPVFESIFKEYQQFNDRMMNMFVDAGLLTADARATMAKVNQDYVPFNRLRDSLEEGKGGGGGFHKLKGGTANLEDILANIQDGITSNVKAALEARAKQRLYQYVAGHRDGAIWATKIAPDSKMVKTHLEDMQAKIEEVLEASGVVVEGELDLSDPGLLNFWQHGVKPTLNESGNFVDTVLVNGKPQYYEVQDPLLQEMLLGMTPESYGSFMNTMFGVKNFFTRSITLGIEFTGANLVRDTIGATFISKNQFTPFLDSFKGMYSYMRKDKHFQDFMRSGGGYSSRLHGSTKAAKARQRIQIKEFGVGNKMQRVLSKLDNIMSAFEYGTRIGEFRLAKKNMASDMDAAFAAREISTDFSVYGQNHFFTGYIRTIPFLNAMIQSQDRIFREAFVFKKYGGNPTALAMKAFLGLTVPTLLLWLINKDDEDYKEIPDHEKRTNWHLPMGDGTFIKVPRPYDVGFAFATMPELFFKYMEDENGREYAEGMAWTLLQMYGVDGVPAAAQGWWDVTRNKKWTGAPVVPAAMADVSASEQYNANTSETFIRLGQALGVSPMKAEHIFKAQTGYLGGYLLWGTEHIMWDKDKFGEKPESDISSNVFLRRFLTPKVRPNNRSMEKFFDLKEQSDRVTADFKAGIDIRRAIKGDTKSDFKRDSAFFGLTEKEKEVLFALNDSMNDLVKVIYGKKGMKTKELAIRYDKKLTGEQKREELDNLWTQRNSAFTQYYGQAKKALGEAKALSKKNDIEDLRMQVLNHTKKGN